MSAGRQTTPRKPGRPSRPSVLRRINAKAQLAAINGNRHLHPKCGAKARSTGEPCRQLAMANGRCRWHGGKTGSGKQWGLPVWPDRNTPGAMDKVDRKLRDLTKAAKKRELRVAAMSPEGRADYEKWKRSHKPGSPADRARARAERKQNAATRAFLAQDAAASAHATNAATIARRPAAPGLDRDDKLNRPFEGAFS